MVNIGVGPSNPKNLTDHLAVIRPHCWLMIGYCGGLRQSQVIGGYVLAHAYMRWAQERSQINLARAIAVDMESGAIAAQGYRFRVPYGTLLCVSDKPLHMKPQ